MPHYFGQPKLSSRYCYIQDRKMFDSPDASDLLFFRQQFLNGIKCKLFKLSLKYRICQEQPPQNYGRVQWEKTLHRLLKNGVVLVLSPHLEKTSTCPCCLALPSAEYVFIQPQNECFTKGVFVSFPTILTLRRDEDNAGQSNKPTNHQV